MNSTIQAKATLLDLDSVKEKYVKSEVIHFHELVGILRRSRFKISGFSLAVILITLYSTFKSVPIYQATTTLLIQQEENKVLSIEELYGVDMNTQDYYHTQYEVLKSRTIAENVVRKLDLINNPIFNVTLRENQWYEDIINSLPWPDSLIAQESEIDKSKLIEEDVLKEFSRNIKIEPVDKTQLVKINFTSTDKELAARAANAIVEAYISDFMESKLALNSTAHSWMQERIIVLENELRSAEQRLHDYRERENLIDVDGVMTLSNSELKVLSLNYVLAKEKRGENQSKLSKINQMVKNKNAKAMLHLPEVLSHVLVQTTKEKLSIAQSKVEELEKRYGPRHPTMIAAISERNAYESTIRRQVQSIIAGIRQQYESDLAREELLAERLEEAKRNSLQVTRKSFQVLELQRQVNAKQELYDTFFKRIQETTATAGIQGANARIVDRASVPQRPVESYKKFTVFMALIFALIGSCAVVLLRDLLNNTIRSSSDVEEKLNLPVLGILPELKKTAEFKRARRGEDLDILRAINDDGDVAYAEAIRTIRSCLTLSAHDTSCKTYMLTSTAPGEGKSSISLALATSLSRMGKTIVVEADLRRPGLTKKLGLKPGTPGLANVISRVVKLGDAIKRYRGLDVLSAGILPRKPQELVATGFADVLQQLEARYEYVIVDCPPVQSVADGIVLAKLCDGLVYVVEAGKIPTSTIQHAIGRLLQVGSPVLGVIINKIKPSSSRDSDYVNGYHGYGYKDDTAI